MKRLPGLICPVKDCLGDGKFDGSPLLFSTMLFLDLEVVGQLLPLPLHNASLAGLSGGLTALYNIM
jgi:hypothetical protein